MTLKTYRFNGTSDRINKTNFLDPKKTINNVTFTKGESPLRCNFELTYSGDLANSNYCYCEEMGRYYYIDDITLMTGNRIILHCSTDVLYTAKDGILNSPAWVSVSGAEPSADERLLNNNYPMLQSDLLQSWEFPSTPFNKALSASNDSCIILVTI